MKSEIQYSAGAFSLALGFWMFATAVGNSQAPQSISDQHLMVVYGTWEPGSTGLEVQDFRNVNILVESDRDLLKKSLNNGQVQIWGAHASNTATAPRARMIILFTERLAQMAVLPQPDASDVLYVQEGSTFRRYPTDSPVLSRVVEIMPYGNRPGLLHLSVEHVLGAKSGGDIVIRE